MIESAFSHVGSESHGLDGVTIHVRVRDAKRQAAFDTWSPVEGFSAELAQGVFDLTFEALLNHEIIQTLESLRGYLYEDPGVRLVPDGVFHLRLFGNLSSGRFPDFESTMRAVPTGAPAIMDLTNFDFMGTLWYPFFREFAQGRPRLVWAVNESARRQLLAAGLPKERLVGTVPEARVLARTL